MTLQEFRFLTDENIDKELVDFLTLQGFDVLDIKASGNYGISDCEISAALANRLKPRPIGIQILRGIKERKFLS